MHSTMNKYLNKKVISLILVALMIMGLVACGEDAGSEGASADADTIKIGALAPTTGDTSVYGVASSNGTKLAIKEINAKGGILGKPVELVLLDEKGDVQEALNAYNRLKEEGIVALVGDVTSKPSISVAERAQEDQIPMITPTGTAGPITEAGDFVFRACFIDPDQGRMMAKYAKDSLGLTKIATLHNNSDDYAVGVTEAFTERAEELGIEIVAQETYAEEDADFKSQLTKIAQANPEAIYVGGYYQKNIQIKNQAAELGIKQQFLGADGWDGILSVTSPGHPEEADGVIFTNQFALEDERDVLQNFVKSFKEEYKQDPVSFAALGYDAGYLMCQAIEKAGSTDPEAIRDAMAGLEYEGVTGNIRFDENGDPLKEISMVKVEDGKYKLIGKITIER